MHALENSRTNFNIYLDLVYYFQRRKDERRYVGCNCLQRHFLANFKKKYSIPLKSMIYSLNKTRKCCWILQHTMYSAHNNKKQLTGCCPKTCIFVYLQNDFTKVENKYVNFWLIVLGKHHNLFTCTWFMYRKRIFNKKNYVSSWYPDKWLLLSQRWTLQGLTHRQ